MKITFLNIYNGKIDRGSEVFVTKLSEQLAKKNEVQVIQSGSDKKGSYKTIEINHIPVLKSQGILYDLVVLWFTLLTLPKLWNQKPDWIIPINGRLQVLVIRLFRFIRGGKILVSGHAGIGFDDKWNIIIGKPNVFIALNPKAYNWSKKIFNKTVFIPNGVDLKVFNPSGGKAKVSLKNPIILCVSALLEYKQIGALIDAVKKTRMLNLLVIGDGPKKEELLKKAVVLKNRFELIQEVEHEKMPDYYRLADVFTLPSKESEAFGMVYIEALASNLPVVAPNDLNRREIINNAGLYCDVLNSADYASKLESAVKKDWGNIPIEQAEKFSWEKIGQKYEEVLNKY